MQFILSQEEYDALKAKRAAEDKAAKDTLQKLCTMVADHMPLEEPNWEGKRIPWRCILSCEGEHFCDHCPVEEMCPNEYKHWSQ